MVSREHLFDALSPQKISELDMTYGWLLLPDEAGLGHIFRTINNEPGLQEHIFIRHPNADGLQPGVTYAVQRVTHQDGVTQREDIFQFRWDGSGNLNYLGFNHPIAIVVREHVGHSLYSFLAIPEESFEIPSVLKAEDIRQSSRLFQPLEQV